jgi:hypothetical protein
MNAVLYLTSAALFGYAMAKTIMASAASHWSEATFFLLVAMIAVAFKVALDWRDRP